MNDIKIDKTSCKKGDYLYALKQKLFKFYLRPTM